MSAGYAKGMAVVFYMALFLGFVVLLPWAWLAAIYLGSGCK